MTKIPGSVLTPSHGTSRGSPRFPDSVRDQVVLRLRIRTWMVLVTPRSGMTTPEGNGSDHEEENLPPGSLILYHLPPVPWILPVNNRRERDLPQKNHGSSLVT